MTDDLITWLRAQLEADEARFRDQSGDPWLDSLQAFLLADIEAKRRILDVYEEAKRYYEGPGRAAPAGEVHGVWTAIRHLATAYVDRPGYREEWRP